MKNGNECLGDILTDGNIDELLSNLMKNITNEEKEQFDKEKASRESSLLSDKDINELLQ